MGRSYTEGLRLLGRVYGEREVNIREGFWFGCGFEVVGGRVYEERGEVIYERGFFGLGVGFEIVGESLWGEGR